MFQCFVSCLYYPLFPLFLQTGTEYFCQYFLCFFRIAVKTALDHFIAAAAASVQFRIQFFCKISKTRDILRDHDIFQRPVSGIVQYRCRSLSPLPDRRHSGAWNCGRCRSGSRRTLLLFRCFPFFPSEQKPSFPITGHFLPAALHRDAKRLRLFR